MTVDRWPWTGDRGPVTVDRWLWWYWHFHSPIGAHQFHKRQFMLVLLRYIAGTKASDSMISTNRQNDRHKKWSDTGPWHKRAYRQESKRCRHTTHKSPLPPGIDPTACKTDILTATPRRSSLHYTTFHLVLRNSTWLLLPASLPASHWSSLTLSINLQVSCQSHCALPTHTNNRTEIACKSLLLARQAC